jgi:hypothetical protein
MDFKWCPETELNRRHADFQSAALPTELSGHISRRRCRSGVVRIMIGRGACPEGSAKKTKCQWLLQFSRCFFGTWLIVIIHFSGRDCIAARQPPPQINVCTAPRAKRAILLIGLFGADRAAQVRTSDKGSRSRLRVISNRPSVVQPAKLVSAASPLNAPRST